MGGANSGPVNKEISLLTGVVVGFIFNKKDHACMGWHVKGVMVVQVNISG